jgi:hypothetical protein
MFLAHFGLGFAAKRVAPRLSLAVLFLAAQFADVLWPVLLLAGIEQVRIDPGNTSVTPLDFISYPWSHSLLTLAIFGVALGVICRLFVRARGVVVVIAALVVSHWGLDVIAHRPDVPLYPNGPKYGLGLWDYLPTTVAVEEVLLGAGLYIYMRSTRARDSVGRWSFIVLAIFLVVAYFANIAGGPPPSVGALEYVAIGGIVAILMWSWWMDRHREPVVKG